MIIQEEGVYPFMGYFIRNRKNNPIDKRILKEVEPLYALMIIISYLLAVIAVIDIFFWKLGNGYNYYTGKTGMILCSFLLNLVLIAIIKMMFKIWKIKFSKFQWFSILFFGMCICVYYIIVLKNRKFIYYWDYGCYWGMQFTLEENFSNGFWYGLYKVARSFFSDYTKLINMFLECSFFLTNKEGDAFVLIQMIHILIPLLVLLSLLVSVLCKLFVFEQKDRKVCWIVGMFAILTIPLLYYSSLVGQPDWFGILWCIMIMLLTLKYDYQKKETSLYFLHVVISVFLILSRRWYLYFFVGYHFVVYLMRLIHIVSFYKKDTSLFNKMIKNYFWNVLSLGVTLGIFFSPLIVHIFQYNYADRYSAYYYGGFVNEVLNQIEHLGILYTVIICVAFLFSIVKKHFIFTYPVSAIIGIMLFTRIQNMGFHHTLFVYPFYAGMLVYGICILYNHKSRLRKTVVLILFCIISVLNVMVNFGNVDIGMVNKIISDCKINTETRDDYDKIVEVSNWISENCENNQKVYIIPHSGLYNPDMFRKVLLPKKKELLEIIPYGSGVLGTHEFPLELFTAKYVITCVPFSHTSDITYLADVYNGVFEKNIEGKFKICKKFDMDNGTDIVVYERINSVDLEEINSYKEALVEENKKYPEMFYDKIDAFSSSILGDK